NGTLPSIFENGESVIIKESIIVNSCINDNDATTYGVSYREYLNGNICSNVTASSATNMSNGAPSVSRTHSITKSTSYCDKGIYKFTITNNGTGSTESAALYNVNQLIGWSAV